LTSSARGTTNSAPDPGLESQVSAAVHRSRQTRRPLTLAFFELDRASDLILQLGPAGITEVIYSLREVLADWTSQRNEAILVNDSRLAMLWDDCPRSAAVELARNALSAIRPWSRDQFPLSTDLTLSIGLATLDSAPKNFHSSDLISAAHRCLSASQLSGGNTVKSIEF
jgi:GGDEF domain-containing protein